MSDARLLEPPVQLSHELPFDPTYGYSLSQLLAVDAEEGPADFDDFWRATFEQAMAVELKVERRPSAIEDPRFVIEEVTYSSLATPEPVRIGAWLVHSREAEPKRGVVVGHGYGGREAPDLGLADRMGPETALIFPCCRGFHLSAGQGYASTAGLHVIHGIEHRDTYSHRGCVADLWLAASTLLELFPAIGHVHYWGGSFGGGLGAMMLPWDGRFTAGHLRVPSFGPHPLRLKMPCTGSGEAVRKYAQKHGSEKTLDVLQYFDSTTAATRITIPMHVSCARFDPAVPPPGQFAVYNAIPSRKHLCIQTAGHFGYEGDVVEGEAANAEATQFLLASELSS